MKPTLRVLITGAAGRIGYSLVPMVCVGDALGKDQPIDLVLHDLERCEANLKGIRMEIDDCAYPLIKSVSSTSDPKEAFTDVDLAILVGSFPRMKGMERKDLLNKNKEIFVTQGKLLDTVAKKTVKVLVVGNPANTNCYICQRNAPSIPKENFSALLRLDQNRAVTQAAKLVGVAPGNVSDVFIWGNHSATQVPSLHHAKFEKDGKVESLYNHLQANGWDEEAFIKKIQQRGAEIINQLGSSSAMSAAKAICDQLYDWYVSKDKIVTMGIVSDGLYSIPKGVVSGVPVHCKGDWKYEPERNLDITPDLKKKITVSINELQEEAILSLG